MVTFAEYVRKHYQTIILSAVALGLALGFWTTAPGKALQTYSQALTFLMILFINLPIAVGLALSSYKAHPLVGLPVALAFILQMLTASTFYRFVRASEPFQKANL